MTLRYYLLCMCAGTLLVLAAWAVVVGTLDPLSGVTALFLFYTTLFLAFVGIFGVAGFAVRVWILKEDEVVFRSVKKTFRQGVLFAGLVVGALLMQRAGVFRWWTMTLLIFLLASIEFFCITARSPRVIHSL